MSSRTAAKIQGTAATLLLRLTRVAALAAAILCGAAPGVATPATPATTDYRGLFESVWSTVDENFYDPTFHGMDWRAVGARYRALLPAVHDDAAFLALTRRMLGELKVSHTHLRPPSASAAKMVGIGADFQTLEGAEVVTDIAPLSDARRAGLRVGDTVMDPGEVEGVVGSTAILRVTGCDGGERPIRIARVARLFPPEHPGWRWSRLSRGPGQAVGYLRIDRFDDGAADLADEAMAEMKDTDGLIIDIRTNSGGNVSALRLASYFMPPGEAPAIALFARPYLAALGRAPTARDVLVGPKVSGVYTDAGVFKAVGDHQGQAVFYTEALGGARYAKPVVIVIGEDTGSAAEGFAWALRLRGHATFVGRKTAGALLSAEDFPLVGGWTLTLPVQGLWGPDGRDFADQAVSPDVPVAWTRADLCQGRDPDVWRALGLLGVKDGAITGETTGQP